jgi:hypothetical protein
MKKIFCAVFLIALSNLTVFAYDDNVGETIGYVAEISGDTVLVVGEPLKRNGLASALVRLGNAPVYDLTTGFRTRADEIKKDADIRVAYNLQGGEPFCAIVVWLNWDEDDAAVFTVAVSENINSGDDVVFLSADGKYRVALTRETIILDAQGKKLSPENVTAGMEFFVWVDMITASTPALVYPDKVVLIQ